MRIAILNPNSTDAMTQDMADIARTALPAGSTVIALTNAAGPPAIQGEADAIACLPGLLALARGPMAAEAEAIVIGCFDDTGLAEMRATLRRPVVGLGEAGIIAATLAAPRFAVLTTTEGSVPVIAANIEAMGLGPRCDGVRAAGIPVLELQDRVPDLRSALAALAADTGSGAIVLGCAGMGRLAGELARPDLPVLIDPVRASVSLAAAVLRAGIRSGPEAMAHP
ncbi:aspartate/glutamate racemase family protein [Roseicyclus amphidinii]|uniref:aspartate/glutamate racemase family protein n=1 Tax=Roseicyclus amphidinii TaxID=3034232 RepID=UPI0024E16DE6|nr:aspartate/glutamate racemase family protein [Roseicyclus sp. Amp-Y-6]